MSSLELIKKKEEILNKNAEIILSWRKSPLQCVKDVWGLSPQAVKPEYRKTVDDYLARTWDDWEEAKTNIKKDFFEPFDKGKNITWHQWLLLVSVEKALKGEASRKIAVESGVGTGKSSIISILIFWFLMCWRNSIVPCTAPTFPQMHDILWKEASLWLDKMPDVFKSKFSIIEGYIRVTEAPDTWYARARTGQAGNSEALAGVHADHVLALIDEGSGVPDEVYVKAEGVMAGENVVVIIISQHTRVTGYFHDCFNSARKQWQNLSFNSEDSPIVNPDFVKSIIEKWGEDSDEYRVQVRGKSPKVDSIDDKGFLPLIDEKDLQWVADGVFVGEKKMGVDCAGEGRNKSVWVIRDRFQMKKVFDEKVSTPKSIAAKTLLLMHEYNIPPNKVYVDGFGVGGKAVQELAYAGKFVNNVNSGDPASDTTRYLNKRAEMGWRYREWCKTGGQHVRNSAFKEILVVRYETQAKTQRIAIMSKKEMAKRHIESPDTYDAAALTFFDDETVVYRGSRTTDDDDFDPHSI